MENFIVSARKYRPDTFESVVGQATITSTLKNAIKNNHLAHAYLFCGPRGVGKTTCARIFAKTINCKSITEQTEACNECDSCIAFNTSRSYNIHELDAASNNSVDDIRTLIDQVRVPPQVGRYSVYIIDEVHMLSQQAFNAFLKTLEEPPDHAIFILATTEKHKIIPTILSRCQIFDFNRILVDDITAYLEKISKLEGIEYESNAFNVIAQKADGAMRDALSVYDQIVSFADKSITYHDVITNLDILDYEYYFKMVDAFLERNPGAALNLFNEILNKGFDGHNFITSLGKHFRDLFVARHPDTVKLLQVGKSISSKYLDQSRKCTDDFIFSALEHCNNCDLAYKASKYQRLLVELTLIKLSTISEKKNLIPESDVLDVDTVSSREPEIDKKKVKSSAEVKIPDKDINQPDASPSFEPATENKEDAPYDSATTSIKNALNNLDSQDANDNSIDAPESQEASVSESIDQGDQHIFSPDELVSCWNRFANLIKDEKPRLSSTMKNHPPKLLDKFVVELELQNNVQADDFRARIKTELLGFLRKELRNRQITINEKITGEGEDSTKRYYTDQDKFARMNEKNPALNKLRQQFNLDFD